VLGNELILQEQATFLWHLTPFYALVEYGL